MRSSLFYGVLGFAVIAGASWAWADTQPCDPNTQDCSCHVSTKVPLESSPAQYINVVEEIPCDSTKGPESEPPSEHSSRDNASRY